MKYAKKSVKAIMEGNPANTDGLAASKSALSVPKENFSCLTYLDHNRAKAQIALMLGVTSDDVKDATTGETIPHLSIQVATIAGGNSKERKLVFPKP